MNKSTSEQTFYFLNGITYAFFNVIRYQILVCLFLWTILSIIWCAIIISKLYHDSKWFKFQSMNRFLMESRKWQQLVKNYNLKRTKKILLILLCVFEAITSLGLVSLLGHGIVTSEIDHYLDTYTIQPFIHTFEESTSTRHRFSFGFGYSMIIATIDIISLLTVCLIETYTYYPSKCKHPVRHGFIRLGVKLSVVMVLSCQW